MLDKRWPIGLLLLSASMLPAQTIAVHPTAIQLNHPRQPQSVQVMTSSADGFSLDLRGEAQIVSSDPKIATIEAGWVKPIANGTTKITVAIRGKTFAIPVKVELPAQEPLLSYRHEVMPVLSRAGCNMGACHGYSLGKNGFKLSLRGADPEQDFPAISREFSGRRINFLTPEASMLVAKPRGDAPHEGGIRFARGSLSDRIVVQWIAQGCPSDLKDQTHVVGIRIFPDKLVLEPSKKHQLQLLADYSDGTTRDVTKLSVFSANNTQFAEVTDEGLVTAGDAGETAIVARFERTFAATSVMVLRASAAFKPTPVPEHLVDRHVIDKLNRLHVTPSELAGDEEFLRRIYLDMIGVQPKPDEIRTFLADKTSTKRTAVIDSLFQRPEFIDHWSLKWGDLLQNSRNSASSPAVFMFREFIRSAVASNMPMDQFARKLLTARGGITEDPASVYFVISKDTNDTVERVTQVFCGVRMLCARCHSHPAENWTQGDYFGLASFFNQVTVKPDTRYNSPGRAEKTSVVQLNLAAGSSTNPRTNKAQPPKFLGGDEPKLDPNADRREAYAQWLTSPDNRFFARGLVNRIWSYYFHRGIIDPVDDIRSTNPPINPALLDALTDDFVKSGYDLRKLMRRIVTSATYQRSSLANASNKHDEQNFSHAIPRRIPAEALLDSLVQATAVPEAFAGMPAGFRAAQLPDANSANAFLNLFGKPQRMDACECERDNSSNMLQALHFINGKSIHGRVQNASGRPALLTRMKLSDKDLVTETFLWSLARHPNAEEMSLSLEFLKSTENKTEALQDLMWGLLNTKHFLMVH